MNYVHLCKTNRKKGNLNKWEGKICKTKKRLKFWHQAIELTTRCHWGQEISKICTNNRNIQKNHR